ncbi:MAG: hypothetical protein IH606_10715 [Burkholderiales bacterium]|nr:hypothetical protein [Burkholderiales bacterium]
MFSLLLICAAVLWSGRVLAAQTPQVAAGVFDASASMQRSGMQPRLAGAANTISKAGAVVTLLPAGGASL